MFKVNWFPSFYKELNDYNEMVKQREMTQDKNILIGNYIEQLKSERDQLARALVDMKECNDCSVDSIRLAQRILDEDGK